ncbi:beta strand repeat-containing protein [Nocardioides marmorisolisilvae]|uniref:beta strand repeat-containing protein n=1 Tax=Nocardioides marmorisolisilvae TaxID=1542737 RepID=UPI001FE59E54|nr:Ig-like domain-containing protein [Nocardioides marmorisolisilvae]
MALVSAALPAQAVQAPGNDVVAWNNGWSWTYATVFNYDDGNGTTATINENATYTVLDRETFDGQDAYKLGLTGTITGGSGKVKIDPPQAGISSATLDSFSGSVSGERYVRVSDLALLQEHQTQNLKATAHASFLSVGVTANIDLTLKPNPSWKVHDFPLNSGDNWTTNTNIDYSGGFTYDAGSLGGTGSSPFGPDTLPFNGPSNVTNETVNVPINASTATNKVSTSNADGSMSDLTWWAPQYKNQAKEILTLPLNGATLIITRNLASASTPGGATFSATATPSLTCAGGTITVSGALSTGAVGVPVRVQLDQSQINHGAGPVATTTTGTNGAYSVTLQTPGDSDGLAKNGSRANWGIEVTSSATTATGATTAVITPVDCSTISYTGATSAPVSGSAAVSAQLTDLTGVSAAGRTITFTLGGGGSVNATTNASGVATATLPMNGPVRTTTITASFAGAANLAAASTSPAFSVTVNPTTTTVLPSQPQVEQGNNVTFSATVTPGVGSNPGGTVQFLVDGAAFGAAVPVSGGTATSSALNTGSMALGDHTVQAVYNGDANFGPSSTGNVIWKVRVPLLASSASLSASPSSTVYGQGVTLSSHITTTSGSGHPTGSVTFSEGGTTFGTAAVDGSGDASVVATTIPVGSHSIVATYSGDDEYNGATSSPSTVTVAKADVNAVLSSSDTTTVTGEAVDYSVSVGAQAPGSGVPSGTAQLTIDGTDVGSPVALSGGVANFDPVSNLLAGSHTVKVTYGGDANFKGGSDTLTQTVTKADTTTVVTIAPSPSSEDQVVNISANVGAVAPGSGAATGLVSFTSDGDPIGSASLSPSSGGAKATLQISTLAPGSHTIVASYEGDDDYNASESAPRAHQVIPGAAVVGTSVVASSTANPSTYGQIIRFTAQVTADDGSSPSGAVQFSVDGTDVGDPVEVVDGSAQSPVLASPEPGDHTVIAAFVGNPGYSNSGDFLSQTVADAGVSIDLTSSHPSSSYGQGVTFTAHVNADDSTLDAPTGHVQFRVDGVALGGAVALSDGSATSPSVTNLAPGDHTVTAVYSGSELFEGETASLTQSVGKVSTTTSLNATPSSVNFGQSVQLTATVTPGSTGLGAPTGTVTFTDGSTTLGQVVVGASGSNGTANLVVTLAGGSHSIKATYSGSSAFSGSVSATSPVTVAKLPTTITAQAALVRLLPPLALPLGQLKATLNSPLGPVGGVPVVFTVGTTTVCTTTTDAYGVATCNAASQLVSLVLFNGYKATFAGNGDYLGSNASAGIIK